MTSCAIEGGCPSDYVALATSASFLLLLLSRLLSPFVVYNIPRPKGSSFWIPAIQVFASFNFVLSIVLSINFVKFKKRYWWKSCYVWAVWIEGPLGFGLLLSCRILQAFQLYHIFVRRSLPPIRSRVFLPLVLLPWIAGAAFMHIKRPLNIRCHMGTHWIVPVASLHTLYVAALVGFFGAIRHIDFRFDELRDLWQGILVSASSIGRLLHASIWNSLIYLMCFIYARSFKLHSPSSLPLFVVPCCLLGIWIVAYVLNEIHDDILWLQVVSRFLLLVMASILVLALFSISSSQPLLSQISLRKKEHMKFETMGKALGVPESGLLLQREPPRVVDPSEPLDKLLLNKRFRHSFTAFADSCLAGESVHFFDEVHELGKIPEDDPVKRIYMARHIIEKYIAAGAPMEVNISHRSRQEILNTSDLAHPDLFKNALNELIQLMKMNLAKDYWSSMYFMKLKEESSMRSSRHELERMTGWNYSPRLSSVYGVDDPFHQEHFSNGSSGHDSQD